jgi:hypothetical protein
VPPLVWELPPLWCSGRCTPLSVGSASVGVAVRCLASVGGIGVSVSGCDSRCLSVGVANSGSACLVGIVKAYYVSVSAGATPLV